MAAAATKNPRLRLLHIRDEIDGVTAALHGVTFAQYQQGYALRRTVERALQIISEAVRRCQRNTYCNTQRRLGPQSPA